MSHCDNHFYKCSFSNQAPFLNTTPTTNRACNCATTITELYNLEDIVCVLKSATGITGHCLANKIMGCLHDCGLDLIKSHGQAYDGAGSMASSIRGTAAPTTVK